MLTVGNTFLLLKPNILMHLHEALFIEATTTLQNTLLPNKPTSLIEARKELIQVHKTLFSSTNSRNLDFTVPDQENCKLTV